VPKPKLHLACSFLIVLIPFPAFAQVAQDPSSAPLADPSTSEKWDYFESETFIPLTLGAAAFNAGVSQITHSAPLYGRHAWPTGYLKRYGASLGDITSENFFADFVLASAFHEDTRYRRKGESHKLLPRIAYAISRAVVTRQDSGGATFNWANVAGAAMSAGLSNAYYPARSRTLTVALTNWGTNVAGSGLVNLMPEFLPDCKRWLKRHHL
jgi:hypothetical protein